MSKPECEASRLFKCGYNCAQAVFAAHAPRMGMDIKTALKISSTLGGGVGRMREVCGAFLACTMILGLKRSTADDSKEEKEKIYIKTQQLAEAFVSENGSLICRELLGLSEKAPTPPTPSPRTKEYYDARPCARIVARTSALIDREIFEK